MAEVNHVERLGRIVNNWQLNRDNARPSVTLGLLRGLQATIVRIAAERDEALEALEIERIHNAQLFDELYDAEAQRDKAVAALRAIDAWAKAYPMEAFPEPDLKKARELLEAGGITIDAVSASAMRHVLTGIQGLVSEALRAEEK